MRLATRDWIASAVVLTAVLLVAGWFIGLPGIRSLDIRAMTGVVLAFGLPVSAAAVVPGFAGLIRGSRRYLLGASLIGFAAVVSAVLTFANATELSLVVLVALMVVLWAMATVRHSRTVDKAPSSART
jgi:hypothetical protein